MKVAVVYWSGTDNTEIMAQAVAEGAKEKGAEATLFTPDEFNPSMVGFRLRISPKRGLASSLYLVCI